ncbi:hypothetical protein D3C85_1623870 [compost metagenome]
MHPFLVFYRHFRNSVVISQLIKLGIIHKQTFIISAQIGNSFDSVLRNGDRFVFFIKGIFSNIILKANLHHSLLLVR